MMGVFFGQIVPVSAFDFFGLFGSDEPPNPSPSTLPYRVEFVVHGDEGVKDALQDSSNLYKLRQDPPPDGEALVQRLTADFAPMLDALWGSGYYNARIIASVGATQLEFGQTENERVARAADAYRNRAVVPVTITVETGPLFRLRNIAVLDASTYEPFPPELLPPFVLKLKPGDPAKAADLRAANERLIDYFRAQSHPLVKAPLRTRVEVVFQRPKMRERSRQASRVQQSRFASTRASKRAGRRTRL